jgi:hypothetical protein
LKSAFKTVLRRIVASVLHYFLTVAIVDAVSSVGVGLALYGYGGVGNVFCDGRDRSH